MRAKRREMQNKPLGVKKTTGEGHDMWAKRREMQNKLLSVKKTTGGWLTGRLAEGAVLLLYGRRVWLGVQETVGGPSTGAKQPETGCLFGLRTLGRARRSVGGGWVRQAAWRAARQRRPGQAAWRIARPEAKSAAQDGQAVVQ